MATNKKTFYTVEPINLPSTLLTSTQPIKICMFKKCSKLVLHSHKLKLVEKSVDFDDEGTDYLSIDIELLTNEYK